MWKVSPGPTANHTPSPIEIKINMFIYVLYLCYKGDLGTTAIGHWALCWVKF